MDKELALILEYNKAPQWLKDAVVAHRASSVELQKQLKKQAETKPLIEQAQIKYDKTAKELRAALNKWTPGEA